MVLIGIFFYQKNRASIRRRGPAVEDSSAGVKADLEVLRRRASTQIEIGDAESVRDPLKRPSTDTAPKTGQAALPKTGAGTQKEEEKLILEGIIWGGAENLAIISGSVVAEGETVKGAKVSKIDEDGVILLKDNSEITLTR